VGKSVLLIVVDDASHRGLFNRFLKQTPHSLVFASNGEDAFERYSEIKPDLVIAHVNSSRLDGTVLCQLVRQQPGGEAVPFVLVGEEFFDNAIAQQKKRAVRADACLPIPFTKSALVQCITPLLAFGRPVEEDTGLHETPFSDADQNTAPIEEVREDTPAPMGHKEDLDSDTVVSFKNPFYRPEVGESDLGAMPDTNPPTELHIEDVPDPAERTPRGIQTSEEVPTGPDLKDPTFIPTHIDPLVEPRIDTGVKRADRPTNSDLISEPVRELTPSASNEQRISQVRAAAAGGQRRGLDESQLGKRLSKRVRAIYKLLGKMDYYRLLGVDQKATVEQITNAYFEYSLEFHPDRFFLLRSGDLKEKIYEVYRQIAQAYRVLSDDRARKKYDLDRAAGILPQPPPELIRPIAPKRDNGLDIPTQTPEAERYVGLASHALGEGDLNGARLHLSLALTYERQNSILKAALADVAKRQKKGSLERA
jgi:CheY-like chemotaxis protein